MTAGNVTTQAAVTVTCDKLWVSEKSSTRHITGHFGDESFQTLVLITKSYQTQNSQQKYTKRTGCHYHHYRHEHASGWRVAVSTKYFQRARSRAYLHGEFSPSLCGCKSASRMLSQVRRAWASRDASGRRVRGDASSSFHGKPTDWHCKSSGDVNWNVHPCHMRKETEPSSLDEPRQLRWRAGSDSYRSVWLHDPCTEYGV